MTSFSLCCVLRFPPDPGRSRHLPWLPPQPAHPGITHLMNVLCQALCMLGNSLRWTTP